MIGEDYAMEPQRGDQVAAVCYRTGDEGIEFCLVRSSAGRRIFPKGKVKKGEPPWEAARREAEEEAGVTGIVSHEPLTTFSFLRPKRRIRETVTAYLLEVDGTGGPRERKRDPKWWTLERALYKLSKKKHAGNSEELMQVLQQAHDAINEGTVRQSADSS